MDDATCLLGKGVGFGEARKQLQQGPRVGGWTTVSTRGVLGVGSVLRCPVLQGLYQGDAHSCCTRLLIFRQQPPRTA